MGKPWLVADFSACYGVSTVGEPGDQLRERFKAPHTAEDVGTHQDCVRSIHDQAVAFIRAHVEYDGIIAYQDIKSTDVDR